MADRLLIIVGARPNFIKLAPLLRACRARGVKPFVVHTGQHFDSSMSSQFFRVLEMPDPDLHLGIQSRTRIGQVSEIVGRLEGVFAEHRPEVCCVIGDVTSTLAGAVAAVSTDIRVAHIEAGLRSGDRSMPEEINRVMTDSISNWLFVSEPIGVANLTREGQPPERIQLVGDLLADVLVSYRKRAESAAVWERFALAPKKFGVATVHRPANVDSRDALVESLEILRLISAEFPVILPLHPRTKAALERFDLDILTIPGLSICEPLDYSEFLSLLTACRFAVSDSGGIQLEATLLDIPCLTLRDTTERPMTIEAGTNTLVHRDQTLIASLLNDISKNRYKRARIPEYWDGNTAHRIVDTLILA